MTRLAELLGADSVDMGPVGAHLDGLTDSARIDEIRSLDKRAQARLFEAAAGHCPLTLDHLVPAAHAPLEPIPHYGKNSLPLFSHFAKVFYVPEDARVAGTERWGYNDSASVVRTMVGPGYFIAYPSETPGELLVDYTHLPAHAPRGGPPLIANEARLGRFVYSGTQDVLRGVSAHVAIGRATNGGQPMDAWFVLCRAS